MRTFLARSVRQSPAMVVAMIALFVALSGTAVATTSALITGKQIRNNSITGADVKNKSLTPRDFRGSVRGPRGFRGLAGAQGPQGAQGPAGPVNPNADKLDGFDANQLAPIAVGQRDTGGGGTTLTAAGQTEVNSVAVTAPVAGVLVITGSVFLNSDAAAPTFYDLIPLLDGATVGDGAKAVTQLNTDATFGEIGSLAYSVTVPVAAGAHTVSQTVGPQTGTANFFYNRNNLSVIFSPQGSGVTTTATSTATAASANG